MSMSDTRRIGAAPIKRPKVRIKFPRLFIRKRLVALWWVIRHPIQAFEQAFESAGQDARQFGDGFTGFESRDQRDEGL